MLPRASTAPARVETENGRTWVLKFTGAGPGPFGILTEAIGLAVARAFGAPVPASRPLYLPPGFPWMAGTDEFDAMLQRSYGWNLGVAFVEGARPATVADLPPSPALEAIAQSDTFLQNMDRTAENPNLLVADGRLVAIDYDACLYLSRALGPPRPPSIALPPGHVLAGRAPRGGKGPEIDFAGIVAGLPEPWIASSGVGPAALVAALDTAYGAWRAAV